MNPGSLSPLPFLPHVAQCIRVSCALVHNLYYLPNDTWESALGPWFCQKQRLPLHLHLSIMAFRAEYKPSAEMILLSHLATFAYHLILHLPHYFFGSCRMATAIRRKTFLKFLYLCLPLCLGRHFTLLISVPLGANVKSLELVESTRVPCLRKSRFDPRSIPYHLCEFL